jgi:murein DD-endopeptidase MepM/ murein hydrolase activator NlpD
MRHETPSVSHAVALEQRGEMGSANSFRFFSAVRALSLAICVMLIFVFSVRLDAGQGKKHVTRKSTGTATWSKVDCGQGVELRVSAASATQGSLLLVEMRSSNPLSEVKAKWTDKDVPFWLSDAAAPKGTFVWRGLLGVDLEQAAGEYKLSVTEKTAAGDPASCDTSITVRAGKFATERLKVAPNFVEPNPEQLAKAEEDSKKLREIFVTVTPEKLWTGRFRVPLDGVKTGGNFGKRRVLNGKASSPHTGVDFPAPTGTPVHAAQSGRVALAELLYFSGNTVVVDHGWGVYTLYGHFSEIDVKAGDVVSAGAVIGKVGATGRVTGPHLHWGLTVDRARVNALAIVGRE